VSWYVLEDKQKAEQQIIFDTTDQDEEDTEPVFDTSSRFGVADSGYFCPDLVF
jgi:hypothetical protein